MNEARPSLAHQAGVITTILLWTLLALVPTTVIKFSPSYIQPPSAPVSQFVQPLGTFALTLTASALASSLLLIRFARVRRLWHAAVLAVVAFGLFLLCIRSQVTTLLLDWLFEQTFFYRFGWRILALFGLLHAAQIAILLCGYRLICRRRGDDSATPEPGAPASSPAEARTARGGTRAEWRAFSITLGGLVLLVGGGIVIIREMQLRQIPAPVWALLRESRDLEILTLDERVPRIPGLSENEQPNTGDFHGHTIRHRVSASTPRDRALLAARLRRALTGWTNTIGNGLPGSHGIRIAGESTTYSLIVSYQDCTLTLYEGDQGLITATLFGSSDLEALRSLLLSADER